jgi:hypothetical protein
MDAILHQLAWVEANHLGDPEEARDGHRRPTAFELCKERLLDADRFGDLLLGQAALAPLGFDRLSHAPLGGEQSFQTSHTRDRDIHFHPSRV